MTLEKGSRLGPYEIVGALGAGGMGEVYRARDSRLGREVAIKVLPTALSKDAERLKRFEREARSASSLNHPNIVTIYDIGSEGGVSYIAMELVTGRPLRSLMKGVMPVRQVLQIGLEAAEGLARAHAAGIVHRDLKPENVMVTEDGRVKILDFGLAKLTQPEGTGATITVAATVSEGTEEGVILGTVGYMSPEQATGGSIDHRSDQFSLGSVLYEMATGRRAFQRGSTPQTLTAIIQDEPEPIAALNPKVPAPLRWTVQRCLAKEPRNRFDSTGDLARDLATIRDNLSEASSGAALAEERIPRRGRGWLPAAVAAVLLIAGGVAVWRLLHPVDPWTNPLAGARFMRLTDWEGSELDAAISHDGKMVAFCSDRDGRFGVWVGQIGESQYVDLTKDQSVRFYPSFGVIRTLGFSGDDTHVSMLTTDDKGPNSIWLMPAMGGPIRPFLSDAVEAAWSPDGSQILYHTLAAGDPTFVVDRRGANPRRVFVDQPGIHDHYPTWSPDGRYIYFVKGIPSRDMDVWRMPFSGGTPERITHHRSGVAYPTLVDDHTLIYIGAREDSGLGLYAMDTERRVEHAISSGLEEYRSVSSSADGRRLVVTVSNPTRSLWTVPITDRIVDDGAMARFPVPSLRTTAPRFGPGFLLHLASRGGADGLWKLKDGVETELWNSRDGAVMAAPAVSSDGARIALVVRSEGRSRLYVMQSDGTGSRRIETPSEILDAPSWSPDGKWIAFVGGDDKSCPLFKVPADGGTPVRLADGLNADPVWSPDGRLILYSAAKGGPFLEVRGVTPDGQPVPLPKMGVIYTGNRYRFLPDGKSFVVAQGAAMASQNFWLCDLATGRLRQLTSLRPGDLTKAFDISPDGKQILFDRYRENSDVVLIDLPPRS